MRHGGSFELEDVPVDQRPAEPVTGGTGTESDPATLVPLDVTATGERVTTMDVADTVPAATVAIGNKQVPAATVIAAAKNNGLTAADLRGLNPSEVDAIVRRQIAFDNQSIEMEQVLGYTGRSLSTAATSRAAATERREKILRDAKSTAARAIAESTLTSEEQAEKLIALGEATTPEQIDKLAREAYGLPKAPDVGADRNAISLELYNRPFAQLNPTQRQDVNAEAAKRKPDIWVEKDEQGVWVIDKRTGIGKRLYREADQPAGEVYGKFLPDSSGELQLAQYVPGPGTRGSTQQTPSQAPAPSTQRTTPSELVPVQGTRAPEPKEPKEPTSAQATARNYAERAQASNEIVKGLEKEGVYDRGFWLSGSEQLANLTPGQARAWGATMGAILGMAIGKGAGIALKVPGVGELAVPITRGMGAAGGAIIGQQTGEILTALGKEMSAFHRNEKDQQYLQAKMDFIRAVLRRESGAAISPQEYLDESERYFPQYWDKEPVLKQKAEARARVIREFERESMQKLGSPAKLK